MHQADNRDLAWVAWVALILSAVCLAFILFGCSRKEIPTTAPRPTILAWVPTTGPSMLPTFPNGEWVQVDFGFPYDQLKAGDMVIFWDYVRGDKTFTFHRLDHKIGDQWVTKGDNPATNAKYDAPFCTRDNYYAKGTGQWAYTLARPAST